MRSHPLLSVLFLGACVIAAPSLSSAAEIKVGASPTPHAEILKAAAPLLKERGHALKIIEYADYVQPNMALDAGELDANYFQHQPYLTDFNKEKGTKIVSIAAVHYEPFGIYAGKSKSLRDIRKGAGVAVPNDTTNEARALLLLQDCGLLKLREGAGLNATRRDISENPYKLKIEEIEAAQLVRSLPDVDYAAINGNYAILGGLKVKDALATEPADSLAASTYANILAVREKDKDRKELRDLAEVLKSDAVRKHIEAAYEGAVVPSR